MAVVSLALVALTTYLLLDRNHAEEVGSGSRIAADVVGGAVRTGQALPLALVLALVSAAAFVRGRLRSVVRIGARQR